VKCVDLEILLCDYVDGVISQAEAATVELHLDGCQACRELVNDAKAAVALMARAADVEPPPALVNRILFELRSEAKGPELKTKGAGWLAKLLEPVLQPKFAMGMAMTILSFSMLGRFAGVPIRQMRPADLEPARIWASIEDKTYRSWERARKYYESLRVVYEIQQTLNDWSGSNEDPPAPGAAVKSGPAGSADEGPIEQRPGQTNRNARQEGGKAQ
jgi:hypothetical protein